MISLQSKITQKILNLFFLHKGEKFYVNEIAKLIKENPANVFRKLVELGNEKILLDEFKGKERYFYLNQKFPLLKEYRQIILKKFGFEEILKKNLEKIKGLESACIFGSYAQKGLSPESDIDILLIGEFNIIELQKILVKLQKETGREINSVELTKKEFEERKKQKDPFLKDIFSKRHIKII